MTTTQPKPSHTWHRWYAALIPGAIFFGVNSFYSHALYHVNSIKILALSIGVTLLFVLDEWIAPIRDRRREALKMCAWLFALLLPTIPGAIAGGFTYNYNFSYELATDLVLILWAFYLFLRCKTAEDCIRFFYCLGALIVYIMLWTVAEIYGLNPLMEGVDETRGGRSRGTYGNSNYLAGSMAPLIPLLFFLCLPQPASANSGGIFSRFSSQERWFALFFAAATLCLYLTKTRAAIGACILVFCGGLLIYLWVFERRKKLVLWISAVLLLGAVGAGVFALSSLEVFGDRQYMRILLYEYLGDRIIGWLPALSSILDSPFIGHGLGSSYSLYFTFLDSDTGLIRPSSSINHAHSEPLELMQEGGVLIIAAYLAFYGYLFVKLWRVIRNAAANMIYRRLAFGILCAILVFQVHGMVSVAQRMLVTNLVIYALYALAFVIIFQTNQATQEPSEPKYARLKRSTPPALVLLAFWLVFIPIALGQSNLVNFFSQVRSGNLAKKISDFVESVDQYPDIYAYDYALRMLMRLQAWEKSIEVAAKIDQIIPGYRKLNYKRANIEFIQNNYPAALALAQEYSTKDRYGSQVLNMLKHIAIITEDQALLSEVITRRLRLFLFLIDPQMGEERIRVSVQDKVPYPAKIDYTPGTALEFTLHPRFVNKLKLMATTGISMAQRLELTSRLRRVLQEARLLRLHIRPNTPESVRSAVEAAIARYNSMDQQAYTFFATMERNYYQERNQSQRAAIWERNRRAYADDKKNRAEILGAETLQLLKAHTNFRTYNRIAYPEYQIIYNYSSLPRGYVDGYSSLLFWFVPR